MPGVEECSLARDQFLGNVKRHVAQGQNAADNLANKLNEAMDFFKTVAAHQFDGRLGQAAAYGVFLSKSLTDITRMSQVMARSYEVQVDALKTALEGMETVVGEAVDGCDYLTLREHVGAIKQKLADALSGKSAEKHTEAQPAS